MFKNQAPENFIACAAAKLHGTFNLDRISRLQCPHLEQFVVFSSISCGYGNLGQTNYGMFNSTMERICEQRHQANLPALAIEWGGVGNVGMFVSMMDGNIGGSYGKFGASYSVPLEKYILGSVASLSHMKYNEGSPNKNNVLVFRWMLHATD